MSNWITICKSCGKKFHSQIGKTECQSCIISRFGYQSDYYARRVLKRKLKSLKGDIKESEVDIKMLSVKKKWNLLSEIDYFRIADIYMGIVCDEKKYSSEEPHTQVGHMLDELLILLEKESQKSTDDFVRRSNLFSKKVLLFDEKDNIIKEFDKLGDCMEYTGLSRYWIDKILKNDGIEGMPLLKWSSN
jgi:hypothetical protein